MPRGITKAMPAKKRRTKADKQKVPGYLFVVKKDEATAQEDLQCVGHFYKDHHIAQFSGHWYVADEGESNWVPRAQWKRAPPYAQCASRPRTPASQPPSTLPALTPVPSPSAHRPTLDTIEWAKLKDTEKFELHEKKPRKYVEKFYDWVKGEEW